MAHYWTMDCMFLNQIVLMEVDVVRYAMKSHFDQVRSVYIQSPQVAYVDLCIGKDLLTEEFKNCFFTGVHTAYYPTSLVQYCDVVFHPLSSQVIADKVYSFALAIAEGKELPEWTYNISIEILNGTLPADLKFLLTRDWWWFGFIGSYCFIHICLIWNFVFHIDLNCHFAYHSSFITENISLGFYISMIILLPFGLFRIFYSVSFVPFTWNFWNCYSVLFDEIYSVHRQYNNRIIEQ